MVYRQMPSRASTVIDFTCKWIHLSEVPWEELFSAASRKNIHVNSKCLRHQQTPLTLSQSRMIINRWMARKRYDEAPCSIFPHKIPTRYTDTCTREFKMYTKYKFTHTTWVSLYETKSIHNLSVPTNVCIFTYSIHIHFTQPSNSHQINKLRILTT